MTTVVKLKIKKGVIVQNCDVYIGRSMYMGGWRLSESKWANPYPLKKYTLEESLRLYKNHIMKSPKLLSSLMELDGKTLGCWCHKIPKSSEEILSSGKASCHGDILVKLLECYKKLIKFAKERGFEEKEIEEFPKVLRKIKRA